MASMNELLLLSRVLKYAVPSVRRASVPLARKACCLYLAAAFYPAVVFGQTAFGDNFTAHSVTSSTGSSILAGAPKPTGNSYAGAGTIFSSDYLVPASEQAEASAELSGGAGNLFAKAVSGVTNTTTNGTTQWVLSTANETLTAGKTVTVSFDFYIKAGNPSTPKSLAVIAYSQTLDRSNFSAGRGLSINVFDNGTVSYYSGTGTAPTGSFVGTFTPGKRQKFSVTMNYATHTFSATIGGASLASGTFSSSVSDLKNIWLNNSVSNDVKFYYDNPKVIVHTVGTLTLASGGTSAYVIVKPTNATAAESTAAQKFQQYFAEITGVTVPILTEATDTVNGPKQILVGYGPRVAALLPEQDVQDLGEDAFVVRTVGEKLVLAGGFPRGTLYAVYDFLEKAPFNCKWWTPTEKTIPSLATVGISHQDTLEVPYFEYRGYSISSLRDDPLDGVHNEEFPTIMRVNGTVQHQTTAWGGRRKISGGVHTHFSLVPPFPDQGIPGQFAINPGWFVKSSTKLPYTSSSETPVPKKEDNQLNLTAPGIAARAATTANSWLTTDPMAAYVSVSENDNSNYCECSACVALRTQYGGRQSAVNLTFVNEVAAAVKLVHPDRLVETLAYRGSVKPPVNAPGVPLLVPADNVMIRFAPLQADFGHLLDSAANGPTPPGEPTDWAHENVRENLPAWAAISKQLFFWHYVANFKYSMLPFPNMANYAEDLQFLFENKVIGVLAEGDNFTNGVGDFVQLRSWVLSKLLWNPYLDQNALVDEFLTGYYGAAKPYLKSYLDLVRSSYVATNRRMMVDESAFSYMDYPTMAQGKTYFDQAESAVSGTPALLARVQRERVSFDLMWAYRYRALKQSAAKAGVSFVGPSNPVTFLNAVKTTAVTHGVGNFQENRDGRGSFVNFEYPRLLRKLQASAALPAAIQSLITPGTEDVNVITLYPDDLVDWNRAASNVVVEPVASTGYALKITDTSLDQRTLFDLSQYGSSFLGTGQWRMFVEARAVTPNYSAVKFVVYDNATAMAPGSTTGVVFVRDVPSASLVSSSYNLLSIGKVLASPTQSNAIPPYSYFYLINYSGGGTTVYIDRVFFVRL